MFDIGWSELLVIGVVALLVVGPKELPVLLRTVGKYVGMMRRQAAEFREQFDEAMRESEFDKLKEDLQKSTEQATSAIRDAETSLDRDLDTARRDMDASVTAGKPAVTSEPSAAEAAEIKLGASDNGAIEPAATTATPVSDAAARAAAKLVEGANSEAAALNGAGSSHAANPPNAAVASAVAGTAKAS